MLRRHGAETYPKEPIMKRRTGSHAVVETLHSEGVTTVFGIPGVDTLGVYDAFLDRPEINAINVRHEQSAVFMADGFARSGGGVGVALTSGGPGALNTLTAMATAHNDSSAVLHLLNENPAHVRRKSRGYFHDLIDQFGIFRPVTDFAAQPVLASEIPTAISLAMQALKSRRPRPAIVEIAGEAFAEPWDGSIEPPLIAQRRQPQPEDLDRMADILRRAERPVIWAGGGVVASNASSELLELAERLGAPVLTAQAGKGSFPPDHELHVGNWANEEPVRDLLRRSDVLLAVGTRFSYFPTGGWSLELPATVLQIDLDPAEIGRNYGTSASGVGDAAPALQGLLDRMGEVANASRVAEVADVVARIARGVGTPPEIQMLDQIRAALPHNARVFNDPTTIAFWARSHWRAYEPRTWFVPSGFGTLGFALPASIGSKIAVPDAPSVAIIGDAGIMFTIQDLMTAVEHSIPVIVIVFNDQGYGVERRHQDHLYGRRSGVDLQPPDFVALAHAFGARGVRVEDLSAVGAAVESALDARGPVVIEVPNRFSHPGYGSFVAWDEQHTALTKGEAQ
jgi:thiamine pyrophosphate-dependent acetolactate synthase large subunit-like protein